ncbi:MAG: hypothetical protein ACE5HY_06705, partial [Candidatus Hydrothermarchaeales archaeon]
ESLSTIFSHSLEPLKGNLSKKPEDTDFDTILNITKRLMYMNFSGRLRRFEKSNPEYIFKNFLYRQSEITVSQDIIHIKLSKRPLDVVLRLSGLIEDINRVPWLDNRSIKFTLEH